MKRKPKEKTNRIHIRRSVYLALIARYEETGVPIVDLASRAIATQLAQQHKPAPSRAYDEEFYAGMELLDLDM